MEQIKNRFTDKIMFNGLSLKAVLENHKQYLSGDGGKYANFQSADFHGADLTYADFRSADFRSANFHGADLRSANFRDADFRGADLTCANFHGADLRSANLTYANLTYANFRGTDLSDCPVKIKDIHKAVYAAASKEGALNMQDWHCGTAHCRAGWVVELAGNGGKALELAMGTSTAAALIYMASDPQMEKIPNFYASNNEALADMKRLAGKI